MSDKILDWFGHGGGSRSVAPMGFPVHGSRPLRLHKEKQGDDDDKTQACNSVVSEIYAVCGNAIDLYELQSQMQASYDLMEEKNKEDNLQTEGMEGHSELDDETKAELERIKEKRTDLKAKHNEVWGRFLEKCPTKSLDSMSPEQMIKKGYFPK
ncbi:hypothetical protein BASA62_006383 [Batrachochytrium salamandrivorans]|nr:hypothetical protein BASA62_006383 [Batrachochytrium salamandrivorans]